MKIFLKKEKNVHTIQKLILTMYNYSNSGYYLRSNVTIVFRESNSISFTLTAISWSVYVFELFFELL